MSFLRFLKSRFLARKYSIEKIDLSAKCPKPKNSSWGITHKHVFDAKCTSTTTVKLEKTTKNTSQNNGKKHTKLHVSN